MVGQDPMDLTPIRAAVASRSYSDVASICDDLFLEAASRGPAAFPDDWPYALHLLAHLFLHDLNSARFLWKSAPQEVKDARPELAAAWRIGQCLWNRDYTGVYAAARRFQWGPETAEFVAAFLESYTKRMFRLLTSAYSTISVADAAHFMGMSEEDATNYSLQHGWSLDSSSHMLTVVKPKAEANQKLDPSKLQRLTEFVFHLEH